MKNYHWKSFSMVCLLLLGLLFTINLDGFAANTVTLRVMRPGYPKEAKVFFAEVQKVLEKEHPHIKLEVIDADWNTFRSRAPIWIAGKQEPDVYLCSPAELAMFADIDALMALDDIIDDYLREDIPAGAWESLKYQNRIVSIPGTYAPNVLWYNKDVFRQAGLDPAKPPATWDELLQYALQIKEKTDVAPLGAGLGRTLDFTQLIWGMLYFSATNANFVDQYGQPQLTTRNSVIAHEFLVDLIRKYQVTQPNPEIYSKGDVRLLLRDEKVAMCVDGPWIMTALASTHDLSDPLKSKFAVAPAPKPTVEGKAPMYAASIDGWVISANTRFPNEAKQLLKVMVSTDLQYSHDMHVQQMPFRKSIYADPKKYPLTDNWIYQDMFDVIDNTIIYQPIIPTASAALDVVRDSVVKMVIGASSVREALAEAEAAVKELNKKK